MIRPATTADVAAIRALEAQSAGAAHWSEQNYDRLFTGDPLHLALVVDEGGVQGFLIARRTGTEWELENIAVALDRRRRGYASALVRSMVEAVQEQKGEIIYLEVRESNAAARAVYARHGFVETGRRRLYYQHPDEDAVLYRKLVG